MSDSEETPWSDNPNAPQIPYEIYLAEKLSFAGFLICTTFYGIVITLFFQCMNALFNPANRMKKGVKWGLAAQTTAMFSFVTIAVAMDFYLQSISHVDDRAFPGTEEGLPPGPYGYKVFVYNEPITLVPNLMFPLNQWLADGLLLYRCYVIYAKSYHIIAFPFLMFIAAIAMGIAFIYETALPAFIASESNVGHNVALSYFSISLALNVILTLMIAIRLVLHSRSIRKALGASAGATGLYNAVVTTLVESYALYAVTYLLYLGPLFADSWDQFIFGQVVGQVQVIAPFLIIIRVANRRALTSRTIVSGNIGSMRFESRGESVSDGTLPNGDRMCQTETNPRKDPEEPADGVEPTIEEISR